MKKILLLISIIACFGNILNAYDLMPERYSGKLTKLDQKLLNFERTNRLILNRYAKIYTVNAFKNATKFIPALKNLETLKITKEKNIGLYMTGLKAESEAYNNRFGNLEMSSNKYQIVTGSMEKKLSYYDVQRGAYFYLINSKNDDEYRKRVWDLIILSNDWLEPASYVHKKMECRIGKCNYRFIKHQYGLYISVLLTDMSETILNIKKNKILYFSIGTAGEIVNNTMFSLFSNLSKMDQDENKKVIVKKYKAMMYLVNYNFLKFQKHMKNEYPIDSIDVNKF